MFNNMVAKAGGGTGLSLSLPSSPLTLCPHLSSPLTRPFELWIYAK